ncbi:hypothetical protein E4U22_007749 [Claviceps purpurea]|nr:hypothetical protein E4U22_007749 [Claviceps purpurea]
MKIILAVTTPSHTKKSIASPTMSDMDVMQSYPDTEIEDGTGPIEELDAVAVREVNGRFELSLILAVCQQARPGSTLLQTLLAPVATCKSPG